MPKIKKPKIKNIKHNLKGDGRYQDIVNKISSNPEKLKDGEYHALFYNPKSKFKIEHANYSGPGTDVVNKLKRGVKGVNMVDNVAKLHDINYSLAQSLKDIKTADERMVKKLDEIQRLKQEKKINILPSKLGIKAQ